MLEGTYLGQFESQYGPTYKFQVGDEVIGLNGGRVRLDAIFREKDVRTGKFLAIVRGEDEQSPTTDNMIQDYSYSTKPAGENDNDIPY